LRPDDLRKIEDIMEVVARKSTGQQSERAQDLESREKELIEKLVQVRE